MTTILNLRNVFLRNTDLFLKARLVVYSLTYAHLIIMSVVLLTKDFSMSDDPEILVYLKLKWKLITTWFNMLTIPYIPLCIYCDWQDLRKKTKFQNVEKLKQFRDFYFTNLILPSTLYADILFWNIYNKNKLILMPRNADKYVSIWEQHSMHTASLIFVVLDLILVPRQRPRSYKLGFMVLSAYLISYSWVCLLSILKGEYVYPGLKMLSSHKLFCLCIHLFIGHMFYFTGQWFVIDLLWGKKSNISKLPKHMLANLKSKIYSHIRNNYSKYDKYIDSFLKK